MCIAFAYLQKNRNKSILPIVLALLLLAVGKLLMVFCVLLIIWLLFSDFNKKTFTSKFVLGRLVKFLGDTSYSVYLLHQLILFPFLYLLFHQAWFVSFHPQMRFFVSFFFIGIPLYGISFLFFKFVELPCIKFGRHILKRN